MLPATDKNLRNFGLVLAAALLILSAFIAFKGSPEKRVWAVPTLASFGAVFGLLGVTAPRLLAVIYKPWMTLSHYMGLVMTSILLTVLYFTLLLPFTLIRLKDPLRKKLGGDTYWEPHRDVPQTLERYRRAF